MKKIACPKCGSTKYTTPGLNYLRRCENDHVYYKVCPFCSTTFKPSAFECPTCGEWLPNMPTSWARSATSLFLLRRVAEYIYRYLKNSSDDAALAKVLASTGVISVDPHKIGKDGMSYWTGTVKRRASEYSTNLKYLGLLEVVGKRDKLTSLGKKFVESEVKLDFDATATASILALRITNKYDSRKTYADHNIRPIFLSLKLLDGLRSKGVKTSIDHIGLAFMCRDEEDDFKKAVALSVRFTPEYIHTLFFSEGRELARAITGVFSNWMEQVGLTKRERSSRGVRGVALTEVGTELLRKFRDEADEMSGLSPLEAVEVIKDVILKNAEEKELLSVKVSKEARVGAAWEDKVLKLLQKIGYDAEKYAKKRVFAKVNLPDEALNALPGGTLHNPDIIIISPLVLVDAKKDVNKEMPKIWAYDIYALHPEVNGNATIVTQAMMAKELAKRLSALKRTSVVDRYALQVMAENPSFFSTGLVSEIIGVGRNEGKYVNEDFVFEYLKSK